MGGGEEGRHEYLFKNELALLALIHVKHLLIQKSSGYRNRKINDSLCCLVRLIQKPSPGHRLKDRLPAVVQVTYKLISQYNLAPANYHSLPYTLPQQCPGKLCSLRCSTCPHTQNMKLLPCCFRNLCFTVFSHSSSAEVPLKIRQQQTSNLFKTTRPKGCRYGGACDKTNEQTNKTVC